MLSFLSYNKNKGEYRVKQWHEQKRYSEMTEQELKQEIAILTEKARKAEQMGMVNEYAVYERKIAMAKAYLLNPDDFKLGDIYEIDGDPGSFFKIRYLNGVFAWGYRLNGEGKEEALPISLLLKP
ncbi:YfhH family protein [Thermaerobacillus caldiproteolyticus]|uniref:YfhH family protein n=1 Tax=Thermaerobacillus caldiproteolyticus TaxID=247480 RepID=UPI0015EBE579|nr:YfhH family protein [Anoxybacillus caldiproteolyticus]